MKELREVQKIKPKGSAPTSFLIYFNEHR
jgi:hypothetical protein